MTYSQLTRKEVINACDGRRLGNVCDVQLSDDGRILALVVPGGLSVQSLFKPSGYTIPWNCVNMIGDDVILVDIGRPKDL
ncbi:MAG: YlmC/YmxH family sporulation protein [Christensenellaceae bacterium]|nr:YlmC/YmxH family sporulation protein [Christensenellaceae bacterium]